MITNYNPAWLGRKKTEWFFILLLPFFCCLAAFVFRDYFETVTEVSSLWWLLLVMCVDVSHVYSTLYRTYFDPDELLRHRNLYIWIPIIAFVSMVMLYSIHVKVFWRCMAYLAVFHFIRQQYGFMRLYARHEPNTPINRYLSAVAVYAAVLYPIAFWHLQPGRNFSWFTEGDFVQMNLPGVLHILTLFYLLTAASYTLFVVYLYLKQKQFNTPKNLIIYGSGLSWYLGIVWFNGDLVFTLLNVLCHGIPYMALVWIYGSKQYSKPGSSWLAVVFKPYALPLFIGILLLFSYLEEGLWDGFVWREHQTLFALFGSLPALHEPLLLNIIVPLLSVPQVTHYLLDAFIWKVRKPETMPHLQA